MGIMEKIFGDLNAKEVKKIEKIVDKIEALDEEMQALSDEELKAKTPEFKERLANGETLDDILVEAFAVCREADARTLGLKPFRVQLIGGKIGYFCVRYSSRRCYRWSSRSSWFYSLA